MRLDEDEAQSVGCLILVAAALALLAEVLASAAVGVAAGAAWGLLAGAVLAVLDAVILAGLLVRAALRRGKRP